MANSDFPAYFDDHNANKVLSVEGLKERIKEKEERIALLKEIKKDGDERLAAQERDIAKREQEIREMEEEFQRQLGKHESALGDAGMRLHRTDKTIISLNEKHRRDIMALQYHQKNKHRTEAHARRQVREEMRLEREQRAASAAASAAASTEQMQAMKSRREEREQKKALEQQKRMAGRNANGGVTNDTGRRTSLSSGSFFSRVSKGGGSSNGTANVGRAGR